MLVIIVAGLTLIFSAVVLLMEYAQIQNEIVFLPVAFLILLLIGLLLYEKLNTARIKRSFGRFLMQVKEGNYESEKSHIIQKYDFVHLTEIQVELSQLVGQIRADYNEQKRYIENVSHELMTPIAIIRGKLELLIQSENIEKSDFKLISDILLKLDRLTRVNQALVLLSKIDYNHYTDKKEITLNDVFNETIDLFEDQINVDGLTIRNRLKTKVNFNMNDSLAYILIKNIIKNAVIHNVEGGFIHIDHNVTSNEIIISNSGNIIKTSTDKLFERFEVAGNYKDSIGLGLSIIDRICEVSDIQLTYNHHNGVHELRLAQ